MLSTNKIMVIDDNPDEHQLVDEAFSEIHPECPFQVEHIGGGTEALIELRYLSRHPEIPRPCIILVDLNMPAVNGLQVISYIKSKESLRDIKTVILSTSNSLSDRLLSQDAGADGFLVKPDTFSGMCELMERVAEENCSTIAGTETASRT